MIFSLSCLSVSSWSWNSLIFSSCALESLMRLKLLVLSSMVGSVPAGFTCLSTTLAAIVVIKRYFASLKMSAKWPCFPPHCVVLTALIAPATWASRMMYVMIFGSPTSLSTDLFRSFCSTKSLTISRLRSVDVLSPFFAVWLL